MPRLNDIDVYVDYSGTLWASVPPHRHQAARGAAVDLKTVLAKQNITLFGELGFENAYCAVMPKTRADQLGIHSIADLASRAGSCRSRGL